MVRAGAAAATATAMIVCCLFSGCQSTGAARPAQQPAQLIEQRPAPDERIVPVQPPVAPPEAPRDAPVEELPIEPVPLDLA